MLPKMQQQILEKNKQLVTTSVMSQEQKKNYQKTRKMESRDGRGAYSRKAREDQGCSRGGAGKGGGKVQNEKGGHNWLVGGIHEVFSIRREL